MEKFDLFIFIDAFGWELLQKNDFLNDILVTKSKVETVLGYSCTCDPTIITGKMPQQHGHFSFFYYNPKLSPFRICRILDIIPRFFTKRGRVRRLLSKLLVRYYGFTGYFQIYNMPFRYLHLFDYSEKRDIYQPQGINSGDTNIFEYLRSEKIPFYLSDWRVSEENNIASLYESITKEKPRFGYLYLAAMDAILHQYGTDHALVKQKIKSYQKQLQEVIDFTKKQYQDVRIHIFSDHGMTNVTESFDLMKEIADLPLVFSKDYIAVYDSTMARFWFFNDRAQEQIATKLATISQGKILSKEDLTNYGCFFESGKFGELFFLMNPGVLIVPSFMGEKPLMGMHGYCPSDKDSAAMFCSNYKMDTIPQKLDDLYLVMKESVHR